MTWRLSTRLLLVMAFAVLAGCDNSGDTTGSTSTTPIVGTPAATVQFLVSSPQIPSSGATTVNLTATVLSASGQTITGKTVVFSTGGDTTAFFSAVSLGSVTDTNGVVTATLNLGANKANRTISISATADTAVGINSVDVVGTAITISGSSSLTFGASTTLTFSLKDSAGGALSGVPMTITSSAGNTIGALNPVSGVTSATGQITATVTAVSAVVSDTITATAAGATKTLALTISSSSFSFSAPAAPVAPATTIDVPLSTPTTFTVNWTNAGVPATGSQVTFSSTRGTIAPVTGLATVDALGNASVSISSTFAGPATVTASGPGGTPSVSLSNVVFVASTASSVTVQAVPGTIQVTTGVASQTSNSSTISVLVRDAASNLVKNAGVNFSITADPSGGFLTSARATTDVAGGASVTYTAGATSSPQNGVIISATVTDINGVLITPITSTATLTVSGQSLLLRLGTDNLVGTAPPAPVYTKVYVATVTDATSNAVVGATVRFSLRPGRFRKGNYVIVGAAWVQAVAATCLNEDVNFDGIIQLGEDTNGNGALDPSGTATVNASAVTGANGTALATVTYPKDHASWAEVILEARSGTSTNDPPALAPFFLPGQASDYSNITVAPPGETSPYGIGALCTDTN